MKVTLLVAIFFMSFSANAGVFQNLIQKKIERKQTHSLEKMVDTQTGLFDQPIDHFDSTHISTFKQRYYIALDFAQNTATAPVIYYQCGEGNCLDGYPVPPAIQTYATALGAIVIILEHRYYGKSQPFDQMTSANLKYLSYEQALEDFATFQKSISAQMKLGGKWIFAGGSYSGALSAYYRLKHPELVVGALSSSGVVKTETSFEEYDRMVATGLGSDCLAAVKDVTHQVEAVLNNPDALAKIQTTFQSQDVRSPLDFLSVIDGMASAAVQYGEEDTFCQTLLSSNDRLAGFAQAGLAVFSTLDISPLEMTFQGSESTNAADYEGTSGNRQWLYQSCTEFGGFAVPYHDPSLSAESTLLDLKYNLDGCTHLFGTSAPDTDRVNHTFYEPLFDLSTTNIFFTNGSTDPYSTLSIDTANQNVTNPGTSAFTLLGLSHCSDLGYSDGNGGMIDQAQTIFLSLAQKWLQ